MRPERQWRKYILDASMKSNVDRMQDKEKTGVFTGTYAINPLNGKKTPDLAVRLRTG